MKSEKRLTVRAWLRSGVLAAVVLVGASLGCGWVGPFHSVRFNDSLSYEDFYRLPPLPQAETSLTKAPRLGEEYYDDEPYEPATYEQAQEQRAVTESTWAAAGRAEQQQDWQAMRQYLLAYLERTADFDASKLWGQDCQLRRNSAFDRLDVLRSAASTKGRQAYFAARQAYDYARGVRPLLRPATQTSGADARQLLASVPAEPALRDNIAYLSAALQLLDQQPAAAAHGFQQLVAAYPRSEKYEAAEFMAAVATMKSSCSFAPRSGDDAHVHSHPDQRETAPKQEAPPPCVDEAWHAAQRSFQQYLAAHPQGQFATEARGWLAYLHLRAGHRARALVEYYRMLANEHSATSRSEAVVSLTFTRHHASDAELDQVEAELADEPPAALAYAYHNLYNYAIDPGCGNTWEYGDDWHIQGETARRQTRGRLERQRIVNFATRLLRRYPQTKLGGAFALRVAQAQLELGENQAARSFATRALQAPLKSIEHRQALFVKGAAEQRLNDYPAARQTLTRLLAETQDPQLTEGPRRLLTMAAEDAGDFDTALEQYYALNYDSDIAYLVDVLLTPEQLSGFLERHPTHQAHNELIYALGIRLLREGHWAEARATLAQVKPGACDFSQIKEWPYNGYSQKFNPKGEVPAAGQGICADWVLRDLKTIDDLERLERNATAADTDETRAEALYQLASYQYEGGTMLFYNPALWRNGRHFSLIVLAAGGRFRAPNEARLLFEAAQNHDALARALNIYLDVVRRFPNTRAARDALYTAAVCHERLAQMNNYWRGIYAQGLFAGERLVTYADVKRAYPMYSLPHGTWGWQPVTRTVNGQAAWLPPPKPQPRPPRLTRLRLKLAAAQESATQRLKYTWDTAVWPSLIAMFWGLVVLGLGYNLLVLFIHWRMPTPGATPSEVIRLNLNGGKTADESVVERIIRAE